MKYLVGFGIGVISTLTVIYIKMMKDFDDFWYWGESMIITVAIYVFTIIIAIELAYLNDKLSKIVRELERIQREATKWKK